MTLEGSRGSQNRCLGVSEASGGVSGASWEGFRVSSYDFSCFLLVGLGLVAILKTSEMNFPEM